MRDEYQMTSEMEQAVITLIDERIKATAVTREEYQLQTHRMDRLENALVQLADAQRRSEERQSQSVEVQRHISYQLHNLTNVVNNLTNVVNHIQQTQITMQQDIHTLKEDVGTLKEDVTTLKEDVTTLKENQRVMQQDIRTLKENQGVMQQDISTLKENQRVMQQDIRTLQENQRTLQENQVAMQQDIRRLDNRVAKLTGDSLEERYQKHAGSYLGRVLRKVRAFKPYELEDELRSKLSDSDYEELLPLDLMVRGIPKGHKGLHVWLAFEISAVVDRGDVERAVRRAELLRHGGYISIPAVAGERLTKGAKSLVSTQEVVVMTNGKIANFHEALARALAAKGPVSSEQ